VYRVITLGDALVEYGDGEDRRRGCGVDRIVGSVAEPPITMGYLAVTSALEHQIALTLD
jgi:hypothetical protein